MANTTTTDSISKQDFRLQVKATISRSWRNAIEDNVEWAEELDRVLDQLYEKYQPLRNGHWSASPKWTEMFQWTAVPFQDIRAIFILMEPLKATTERSYRSTGYALGVEKIRPEVDGSIEEVSTVWNFFHLLHLWSWGEWDLFAQEELKQKYWKGFCPLYLSHQKRYLFLNLGLTRGERKKYDLELWQPFIKFLLDSVPPRNAATVAIPVIQLYNNQWLQQYLETDFGQLKFITLKGSFMSLPHGPNSRVHIGVFAEDHINTYVDEINWPGYQEHRRILQEFVAELHSVTLTIA